jgi:hypothetical protein
MKKLWKQTNAYRSLTILFGNDMSTKWTIFQIENNRILDYFIRVSFGLI